MRTGLQQILKGKNKESDDKLNELCSALGNYVNIAWYPSAGTDFRDIHKLLTNNKIDYKPNMFIHTDCNIDILEKSNLFKYIPSHKSRSIINEYDENYSVLITEVHELDIINSEIQYSVDSNFVEFPQFSYPVPKIYLLFVSIGELKEVPVIYFAFENINFLKEILLKNKIKINFLIKVRDGMAYGGNCYSVANIYAFAVVLGINQIVVDNLVGDAHEDGSYSVIEHICLQYNITNKAYSITPISRIHPDWSGLPVHIFKIIESSQDLERNLFKNILNTIEHRN